MPLCASARVRCSPVKRALIVEHCVALTSSTARTQMSILRSNGSCASCVVSVQMSACFGDHRAQRFSGSADARSMAS